MTPYRYSQTCRPHPRIKLKRSPILYFLAGSAQSITRNCTYCRKVIYLITIRTSHKTWFQLIWLDINIIDLTLFDWSLWRQFDLGICKKIDRCLVFKKQHRIYKSWFWKVVFLTYHCHTPLSCFSKKHGGLQFFSTSFSAVPILFLLRWISNKLFLCCVSSFWTLSSCVRRIGQFGHICHWH